MTTPTPVSEEIETLAKRLEEDAPKFGMEEFDPTYDLRREAAAVLRSQRALLDESAAEIAKLTVRADVENMPPAGEEFLAENQHGDWMVVRRFDPRKPRDYSANAVINGRLGRWWYPTRWRARAALASSPTQEDADHG